jgi:hypothetical protein
LQRRFVSFFCTAVRHPRRPAHAVERPGSVRLALDACAALALTHLITVGFMLQVMLGAMIQILPVVAGANISRPLLVATLVHAAIALAPFAGSGFAELPAAGFLKLAVLVLGSGVALFVGAAGHALVRRAVDEPDHCAA